MNQVIAAVDGSATALDAARWAAREAAPRGLPLRLLHVYPPPPPRLRTAAAVDGRWATAMAEQADRVLAEASAAARAAVPGIDPVLDQRVGVPSRVLIELSERAHALVLGNRGLGGFRGLLAGSLALALAAHAHSPVVVVRGSAPEQAPVVVGVDHTPAADGVLAFAFDEAAHRRVPLRAVHTWLDIEYFGGAVPLPYLVDWEGIQQEEDTVLAERLARWTEKYPDVPVTRRVARGRAAGALVGDSEGAQLLVVGSHFHNPFAGVTAGATAQAVLHHSSCPVAVVPVR
ncbi:universal stress protein [Actinokineospora guangxiensis]|uniref:Universal stress protein n=1 Tax=Actinokineospora guangxiensis TaxID=1490288 RepID=A0ABW0EW46_9PSEU